MSATDMTQDGQPQTGAGNQPAPLLKNRHDRTDAERGPTRILHVGEYRTFPFTALVGAEGSPALDGTDDG